MRLVLVGFGNVANGFVNVLKREAQRFAAKTDCVPQIVGIATARRGARFFDPPLALHDLAGWEEKPAQKLAINDLATHAGVDVIIECTPTQAVDGQPALDLHRLALAAGKHVVSANKGPAAHDYRGLNDLAHSNRCIYGIEASVMSGTPCLRLIDSLSSAGIKSIRGIFNGTTNFILTEMEAGSSYLEALRLATERGYAEPDPSGDVDGHDVRLKVMILSQVAFGLAVEAQCVYMEGIRDMAESHVAKARAHGLRVKLIGQVEPGRVAVERMMIPESDALAAVSGATNAMAVETETLGTVSLVGAGAGACETGFGLLLDLYRVAEVMRG